MILGVIITSSAAAAVASVFWKPPSNTEILNSTKKKPRPVSNSEDMELDDIEIAQVAPPEPDGTYKNGTLTGKITDRDGGAPIANATVYLQWYIEARTSRVVEPDGAVIITNNKKSKRSAKTDAQGNYTIEIPKTNGMASMRFSAARYRDDNQSVGFHDKHELNIELDRVPGVIFNVKDKSGNKLSSFSVYCEHPQVIGSRKRRDNFELEAGEIAWKELDKGTWNINAYQGSSGSKMVKIFLGDSDQTIELTIDDDLDIHGEPKKKGSSR